MDVNSVTPIKDKGIVNLVYLVETKSGNKYIARLNDISHVNEFKKEKWASDEARSIRVSTPEILHIGSLENISYSIQEYIQGVHGVDYKDKIKLWHDIGKNARLVHSIKVKGFGDSIDENESFVGIWNEYLDYNIKSLNEKDPLLKKEILTREQFFKVRKVFEKLKEKTFNFGLVHGDLSLKNSMVDTRDKVWIIDWGSAHAHIVPHYDFVGILQSSLEPDSEEFKNLLKGYSYNFDDFNKIKTEVYSLMLLQATDKVRWTMDKKPELLDHKINDLKKVLAKAKEHIYTTA